MLSAVSFRFTAPRQRAIFESILCTKCPQKIGSQLCNVCLNDTGNSVQLVLFGRISPYSQLLSFLTDDGPYQRDLPPPPPPPPPPSCPSSSSNAQVEDRRKSHIPEEFAGLLHGSSPACENPDTPYHLYSPKTRKYSSTEVQSSLLQTPEFSIVIGGGPTQVFSRTGTGSQCSSESTTSNPQKPQVVYRTIFHTRVNQEQARSKNCDQVDSSRGWSTLDRPPSYYSDQNREDTGGEDGPGYEERACTLGRMRSMPRSVMDLQLSKSLSKSDSNLVSVSPIQVKSKFQSK